MFELFTLGGGTYLVDLLNAVAAITGGGAYIQLAQIAGVGGLAWVLLRTAFGGSWKDNAKWVLLFVAVWGAMIVPKATVRVVDRLDPALAPAAVANVPVGLSLFASLTSQVGDGLTRLSEQAFTLPNDLRYHRHGLIFGARLAAKATRLEATDAVFGRNLRNYARQCVFHALLLGHVSADDLRESTDLWTLITATGTPSAGASPARMVEFATRAGGGTVDRAIVTCRDAAGRLDAQWTAELGRAGTVFGRRLFPDAATDALARAELLAALPAAHDFLIGASRSAAEIMRQQMTLNAVHAAGEQWAAEAGNAAALRAYTEARAEAQTVSAYRAIGRQAETWVPLLRIVFECLYVGAFPMAVLLMLTPAGATIFRSYVTGLIWLQSWGPLYAVLHRISMGEAAERMSAAAMMPGGDVGISLVAQAGIRAVASDVAVMSGYLSMSVPFLAAALAYGLSKATVLATSVLAVGQDAASSAAHEGTTGNIALASTAHDTHRFATLEGRQVRTSAHVDTGRFTGYAPGGSAVTVTGDGTVVLDAGAATSRIPAAGIRLSETVATHFETRAAEARSLSHDLSVEAGSARNAAVTDATALVERYGRDVSTGEAYARGVTESESTQAQALESHMEKLAETAGLSKSQALMLTGEATIGGGLAKIVKIGAGGSATWRGQTIESDDWNRVRDYAEQHQVLDLWSRVSDAARRYSTATGESEAASLEESLSANLTRMRSFQERASVAHRESESWSEQEARARSEARAIDRDLGQAFFVWLAGQPGSDGRPIGEAGATRLAEVQTPEDVEALNQYAAAFVAERYPAPAGPDPAEIGGRAEYTEARDRYAETQVREVADARDGWRDDVRDRALAAGAPEPGDVESDALRRRAETKADMTVSGAGREARAGIAREKTHEGRAGVAVEADKPLARGATESAPSIGGWLANKLFGTAENTAPDGTEGYRTESLPARDRDSAGGEAR
ncbi:MAG: conjugal transfer protein TraG N-terminal domain-containing protein [Defluviicoccus sp.]|nr:conjugal transfer protein TraG N-terminal domain-containing protein [Defluviicoccus sp.]